mmetsp:Transcript_1383/g.3912  ORF Transcript_1383/g.3912 Transcript_1383/m.3912 type:complete len:605 (-) Transcript_1383:192-2006(-)
MDAAHVTQAALIEDANLGITATALGGLVAVQDFTSGIAKFSVAVVLRNLGPRNAWLIALLLGAVNMLAIAAVNSSASTGVIFSGTVLQSIVHAWLYPATTMTIAGWIDGHLLGRSIGCVAVATKVTPIFMSLLYGQLLKDSWRTCYYFASALFAGMFLVFVVLMRSSALAIGFRTPTPPGSKKKRARKDGERIDTRTVPPLANEPSSCRVIYIVFCMRRTWALLLGFSLLVLLKSSAKFASVYAKTKLGVSASEGTTLFTTYAIASAFSGTFGGVLYDVIPGGKIGVGVLMTALNLLNLGGFVYALVLELNGVVTMQLLQVFMAIVGFASVLPVSLPFQIYAMAMGGVDHCGMLVAAFECFALVLESILDLIIGSLLDQEQYGTWLALNIVWAVLGTLFMALFYYLDYRKAPKANVLTSVPSMNSITRTYSKLRLWAENAATNMTPASSCASLSSLDAEGSRSVGAFRSHGSGGNLSVCFADPPATSPLSDSRSTSFERKVTRGILRSPPKDVPAEGRRSPGGGPAHSHSDSSPGDSPTKERSPTSSLSTSPPKDDDDTDLPPELREPTRTFSGAAPPLPSSSDVEAPPMLPRPPPPEHGGDER